MNRKINITTKSLFVILGIISLSVFTITIAYAALSTTLNILGNAQVSGSNWDIHLDNIIVTTGSVNSSLPTITEPTTANFSVTLNMPGDYYEFSIDVVNDGTIDAMIDNVIKTPELTTEQTKYLKYEITYQNGNSINTKQLVSKNSYVRLKIRLEYRNDLTSADLPSTTETLNLSFTVNYIQSDNTGYEIDYNGRKVGLNIVSGDIDTVGTEICTKDECFYVISSTEDTVKLFSKYNIYIGRTYNVTTKKYEISKSPNYRQMYAENGYEYGTTMWRSVTEFSQTTIADYLKKYSNALISEGIYNFDIGLISYEDLTNLGCKYNDDKGSGNCDSAPEWVSSTSYWTESPYREGNYEDVFYIDTRKIFNYASSSTSNLYGIRPVITVPKSQVFDYN